MRIGFDATPLLTAPRFGIHQHAYQVVRHLARLYPEDTCVLFFDRDVCQRPSFDPTALTELGPNVEPVPLRTIGPTPRLAEAAWWRWHLPRAIRAHGVEVFHGLAHMIPFTRRCPLVLTVHDLMPVEYLSWAPGDPAAVRVRRSLLSAIRRASALATVSESTRRDVLATGRVRARAAIAITPNAARDVFRRVTDAAELAAVAGRYGLPTDFVVTVGADTPRRNYARLLHGLAEAKRRTDTAPSLVIVGNTDWPLTAAYRLADGLCLRDRVVFCHGVGDEELAAIYSLAVAYICPSLHEGFGMPVVEALACGTPVFCSDIPALREVADKAACLFDPTDVDAIAGALLSPLPVGRRECRAGDEPMAVARRFTWERAAEAARGLYGHVCGGRPELALQPTRS